MHFVAFNLDDFHVQNKGGTKVGVRFLEAKSLEAAKQFMSNYYQGGWAVVDKRTFDKGIVFAASNNGGTSL